MLSSERAYNSDDLVFANGVDIPSDTSTTANIAVGGSVTEMLETVGDSDWFRIELREDQTISVSLEGSGATPVGDTYLRLYDSNGTLVAENDDGGTDLNSLLRFTANSAGTYYIEADSWNGGSSGEYTLAVTEAQPLQVYSLDEIAGQLTAGYWGGDERSFSASTIFYEFVSLSNAEEQLALTALSYWESLIDISFSPTFGSFTTNITFQNSEPGAYAQSMVQYWDGTITSSIVNISSDWVNQYGSELNDYSFQTYVHEIGHALGLGHAGNYNGNASYATDALYLNDSWATTIMSYFDQVENSYFSQLGYSRTPLGTPMLADIVAIQNLYGAGDARTGNTIYGFNISGAPEIFDATLYSRIAYTVYDTGGRDTLDYSGFGADQLIDLRAEHYSNIGGSVGNVAIARGVIIEDARGGSGSDQIFGNDAVNYLWGNSGNDILDSGRYPDVVRGGDGDDHLMGGFGSDVLRGDSDMDLVEGGAGWDNLFGGSGDDILLGNNGNDRLYGDGGNDRLEGGSGGDLLRGAGGNDFLDGGDGNDTIRGEWGSNTIFGRTGADTIFAGQGFDTVRGGSGSDLIYGERGNDKIFGEADDDEIFGGDGADRIDGGAGNDLLSGGVGNDLFVFTAFGLQHADKITDFENGDKIGLDRGALFSSIEQEGALDPSAFVYGTEAMDSDDRIIYQYATGKLFYDADGVGGADAVLFAEVEPESSLNPYSFLAFGEAAPPPAASAIDPIAGVDPVFA
ncbi:hypothetical protein GRI69_10320 [Erythrobacter vulgaris]|uniref:Peptidase metallopeptidase domain-containing protein n=1 Tax=Qipengyuania vulgaris TaxID=291985 RepID=A0A844XUJ9_9SPHN|nr:M10 family metallopeptidase C-terminal domain-containing protein [Qipengyuania vulgaris]MXO48652.1 hypothetical protein [Qipengyuania vulgaris]